MFWPVNLFSRIYAERDMARLSEIHNLTDYFLCPASYTVVCVILILVMDYLGLRKTHDGDVFLPLKKPLVAERTNSR